MVTVECFRSSDDDDDKEEDDDAALSGVESVDGRSDDVDNLVGDFGEENSLRKDDTIRHDTTENERPIR